MYEEPERGKFQHVLEDLAPRKDSPLRDRDWICSVSQSLHAGEGYRLRQADH